MRSFRKLMTLSTAGILLGTVVIGTFFYHLGFHLEISVGQFVAIVERRSPQIPIMEKSSSLQRPPPATTVKPTPTPIANTNTGPPVSGSCPTPKQGK